MINRHSLALAAICLSPLICGCGDPSVSDPSVDDSASDGTTVNNQQAHNGKPRAIRENKQLFDGWTKPAAAIVLTGQQRGYIEPCGCTEGQSGGISRRASLIQELKDRDWPLTAFDLGGIARRSRRQSQVKFETMLEAMKDMGYRGLGVSPFELRFGLDFLLSLPMLSEDNADSVVPLLAANVVLLDTPDLGTPVHLRVTEVAGQKIGVTAIIGEDIADKEFPDGPPRDIAITDAAKSLEPVVQQLKRAKTSLNILLAYAGIEESKALAKQFPDFHVVVTAGGPEDPGDEPRRVGKTLLLSVGQKGKYTAVVGLYPKDEKTPLRYQLVELKKDRFKDNMKMVNHMKFYQGRLKQEKLAASELPIRHPSGAEFVGAEACRDCHTTAYDIWKKTPHAHAFESLKKARKGDPEYGITRIYDAECLACHVTGWHPQQVLRYETGFVNEEFATETADKQRSKLLQGQQCESCHGPGSRHMELIDDGDIEAAREAIRVTLKQAEEKTCVGCHDYDNSPHFDFKKYWERVKHYGTD